MSLYELLKSMQAQLDFNEADQKRLQEMGLWLMPYSGALIKTFYAPLDKFPANKVLLDAVPGRRTKMRLLVGDWYASIFSGPYNADYAQRRWDVGVVHRQLGIPLVLIVNAIENVYRFSAHRLGESASWLKGPLPSYIKSLTKMLNVDLAFVGRSYADETIPATWPTSVGADARTCQGLMSYGTGELLEAAHFQF